MNDAVQQSNKVAMPSESQISWLSEQSAAREDFETKHRNNCCVSPLLCNSIQWPYLNHEVDEILQWFPTSAKNIEPTQF